MRKALFLCFVVLLLVPFVYGVEVVDQTATMPNQASNHHENGVIMNSKIDGSLLEVCIYENCECDTTWIFHPNGTFIDTQSISDRCSSHNVVIVDGQNYNISCNSSGGSYRWRWNESPAFPYNRTNVNFEAGFQVNNRDASGDPFTYTTDYVYNIFNVTTEESVPPVAPPNLSISSDFLNDSGVSKLEYWEFENINFFVNASFNGSSRLNMTCIVHNENNSLVETVYNSTSGLYESVMSINYDKEGNYTSETYCFDDVEGDLLFFDPVEHNETGINTSASEWSDQCVADPDPSAVGSPVYYGSLSSNSSDAWQLTSPAGACIANCSTEFYIYKEPGKWAHFTSYEPIGFIEWDENDSISIPASVPDWVCDAGFTSLSSNMWHKVKVVQTGNTTLDVYVDDILRCNNTIGGGAALPMRIGIGQCEEPDEFYTDFFRMGNSETLDYLSGNYTAELSVKNIRPVASILAVNNSNGYFNISNDDVFEYSGRNWLFNVSAEDNDLVTYNVSVRNVSNIFYSREESYFFFPSVWGFNFSDFGGNPYNITFFIVDDTGAVSVASVRFNVTDSVFPVCYGLDNINVSNETLYMWDVNCYDENFFSFNISCSNGFNETVEDINNFTFVFNGSTLVDQDISCGWVYCDGHTARDLPKDVWVQKRNKSVKVERNGQINTFQVNENDDFELSFEKKKDRISYTVDFRKDKGRDNKRGYLKDFSFLYHTSGYSFYVPSDKYQGWIVDLGSNMWFDTNLVDDPGSFTSVNRINRTTYEVTVWSYGDLLEFESIGPLNCESGNQLISIFIPSPKGELTSEFSTIPEALFYIFLVVLWLIFLVLTLTMKGFHGRTIGLLNIMQGFTGVVVGLLWLSYSVPIGVLIVGGAVGFFSGLTFYDNKYS